MLTLYKCDTLLTLVKYIKLSNSLLFQIHLQKIKSQLTNAWRGLRKAYNNPERIWYVFMKYWLETPSFWFQIAVFFHSYSIIFPIIICGMLFIASTCSLINFLSKPTNKSNLSRKRTFQCLILVPFFPYSSSFQTESYASLLDAFSDLLFKIFFSALPGASLSLKTQFKEAPLWRASSIPRARYFLF